MVKQSWNLPQQQQSQAPAAVTGTCPLWGSARLTYTLCAFTANVLQMGMRNMLGLIILRMVQPQPVDEGQQSERLSMENITLPANCGTASWQPPSLDGKESGDLPWSRSQALAFPGVFYYGYVIALPLAGHLTDRFGGKKLFINSLTMQAIAYLLLPVMAQFSYATAVIVLVIAGVFGGCGAPPLYQLFVTWAHPTERTAMLSFAYSGLIVGSIGIYPLATSLSEFGWRVPFYVVGTVSLLYGLSCNWFIYNSLNEHPRVSDAEREYLQHCAHIPQHLRIPWRSLLTSLPVYAFIFTHVFHNCTFLVFSQAMPRFMREAMHFNMKEIGFLSSAPFLGSLLSKLICVLTCSIIERRIFAKQSYLRRVLYAICSVITVVLITIIIFASCEQKTLVLFIFVALGVSTDLGFSGGYWPCLLYFAPSFAGMISGLANSVAHMSGFLAPHLIATLVHTGTKAEWNYVLMTLILTNVLAIIVFGLLSSTNLQPWDPRSQPAASKPSNTTRESSN